MKLSRYSPAHHKNEWSNAGAWIPAGMLARTDFLELQISWQLQAAIYVSQLLIKIKISRS